jgi:F420-non-reducing hydrogenase large subunit
VTSIIGQGNTKIFIGDKSKIEDAESAISSTKIFQKICEGRFGEHIPRITSRLSGIGSIAHHIVSAKALEDAWNISVPESALKLRKLLINAKQFNAHLLHYYSIISPDYSTLAYGEPSLRNVMDISRIQYFGESTLKMLNFSQNLIGTIGGKSVHPVVAIVGGMKNPLTEDERNYFLTRVDEQIDLASQTLDEGVKIFEDNWQLISKIGDNPCINVALTNNGVHDIYEGKIRIMDTEGSKKDHDVNQYLDVIDPSETYRSNCLSMINSCDKMATPLADEALKLFREKLGSFSHNLFILNWARLIEAVESIELIKEILEDTDICNLECKTVDIEAKEADGVGIVESPRGLIIHHIWSDNDGICKKLDVIDETNLNIKDFENSFEIITKQLDNKKIMKDLK